MSRPTRFAALTQLLIGASSAAITAPPAEPSADDGAAPAATVDAAKFEAAVQAEIDKEVSAANTRWNAVITSDAGVANPKAAARMCNTSTMSAEDIIATLGDIAPAAAAPAAPAPAGNAAMRNRLQSADGTAPITGGGDDAGDDAELEGARARRKAAQDKRNKSVMNQPGARKVA